jgi:hypothetical protein
MKKVLIVGGGPSGLVAAKTLLQRAGNPFNVSVYEAAERVGGMWKGLKGEHGNKCSPDMRTNLSRFTVAFADLSWHAVDLENSPNASPPMFPEAHQVGRYLKEYARKFVPQGTITCNRKVTSATLNETQPRKWTVSSLDTIAQATHTEEFDYLIIASGFFDTPVEKLAHAASSPAHKQHSADFRHVSTLCNDTAGKLVVIGGGISGSEAAATAAFQISNARYAPGKNKPAWSESVVYHVFDRPFYCLPRYLPQNPYEAAIQDFSLSPNFLPLDLVLYELSRRGDADIQASNGPVPPEKARKGHEFVRTLIGGDQKELGRREMVYKPGQTDFPSYTALSDTYAEFVRSGLIVPVKGRAQEIQESTGSMSVQILEQGPWALSSLTEGKNTELDNVTGIIEATGFQVQLDYLSTSVKHALDYDATCQRVPFLLSRGSIFHPAVPEMAFVGFYEGPYWGVMEMQAHLVAANWDPNTANEMDSTLRVEEAQKVREAIQRRDLSVPQFWMMDYVGLVEEFSRLAGITRNDNFFPGRQTGPALPARYAGPECDQEASTSTIREVSSLISASEKDGRFVAAAAFRAMQGPWTLQRKIDSRHASSPGGVLKGVAHFHPRIPTSPTFAAEYLYIESGTFTMDTGFSFPATRRYVYRYNEFTDQISTYFVEEDGETAGAVFNRLVFEKPRSAEKGWLAKSSHWCSPDQYECLLEFRFRGVGLRSLGVRYDVKGPSKDYTHESWYERPPLG